MTSEKFQTVAQLTESIKYSLNVEFADVWVTGEVSGLTKPRSGHIYFTLKDESAQISTVIWRSSVARLNIEPEEGMQILCRGHIDVYPQRGNYQLIARVIQPIGEGNLQIAFRKLHDRLKREGIFDDEHKQPIPKFPKRIALITSPTGAAIHDFLNVAARRWKGLDVTVVPVQVQGSEAPGQIVDAIRFVQEHQAKFNADVLVVTRGGGSIEDLWAFNDEKVVRAIFECDIPVVSAIGHEIDVSLCDLVADARALTPSEAGELLTPDSAEVRRFLRNTHRQVSQSVLHKFQSAQIQLGTLVNRRGLRRPLDDLRNRGIMLDAFESRLVLNSRRQFEVAKQKLDGYLERLRFALKAQIPKSKSQLSGLLVKQSLAKPLTSIRIFHQDLENVHQRMLSAMKRIIESKMGNTKIMEGKLQAFNPEQVLNRGYSLTLDESGNPIADCNILRDGDTIQTVLSNGRLRSVVNEIERKAKNGKEEKSPS